MPDSVPSTSDFSDIYPEEALDVNRKRWHNLLSQFEKEYGRKADFVARSPGRVNIIGEHIDYSLYECLPMAVTADVCLAVSPTDSNPPKVRISNTNSVKFPSREFEIPENQELPIDADAHDWSNYFRSGVRGASQMLQRKKGRPGTQYYQSVGMDIMVDGTVPSGGGLSSSAAFVCSSSLAVMRANGETVVDKTELTELAIVSERAVGVNSGGMDQAASVFSQKDSGLYIAFVPKLSATPVTFPTQNPVPSRSLVFLISQTYVASDKRVTGPVNYNLRVVECTLAACYLAKILKLSKGPPQDAGPLEQSLRGLHDLYFSEKENTGPQNLVDGQTYTKQLEKLIQLTDDYMVQEEGYTREEIAEVLGISVDELNSRYTTKVPIRAERFKLRQRAFHVFSEALRVQRMLALLQSDEQMPAEDMSQKLGQLVTETHTSCKEHYECSCPELDQICQIALENGSWGGRLTGAGWGGCSVHLVPAEKVDQIRKAWVKGYYDVKFPGMTPEQLEEAIVVTKPGRGSMIYEGGQV